MEGQRNRLLANCADVGCRMGSYSVLDNFDFETMHLGEGPPISPSSGGTGSPMSPLSPVCAGGSILHKAANRGKIKTLRSVLSKSKNPPADLLRVATIMDGYEGAVIHAALLSDCVETVREVLIWAKDRVQEMCIIPDSNQQTPMTLAIQAGSRRCIEALCQAAPGRITESDVMMALRLSSDLAQPIVDAMTMPVTALVDEDGNLRPCNFVIGQDPLIAAGSLNNRGEAVVDDEEFSKFRQNERCMSFRTSVVCQINILRPAMKCNRAVLYELSNVNTETSGGLLNTMAARAVITAAWDNAGLPYAVDSVVQVVRLAMLVWFSYVARMTEHFPGAPLAVLSLLLIYDTVNEICQANNRGLDLGESLAWYCNMKNFQDVSQILFVAYACITFATASHSSMHTRLILSVWVVWRWMTLAWHLRVIRYVGTRSLLVSPDSPAL